jgi:hypothetical protein
MTKQITTALAAGALLLGASHASAAQIDGTINFGSTAPIKLNAATFPAATAVDFQSPAGVPNAVVIPGSTGDFSLLVGQTAVFQDFTIGASVGSEWALSLIPGFSFDLATSANLSANNIFLNIVGTGVVHAPGFENTPGTFTLTASRSGGDSQVNFSFAASTTAVPRSTPDGGATALLLGAGLLGMGAIARRK